jgi:hypothetical protein
MRKLKKLWLSWDKVFRIIFKVRWHVANGNMLHAFLVSVIYWDKKYPDVSAALPTPVKRLFRPRTQKLYLSKTQTIVAYILDCPSLLSVFLKIRCYWYITLDLTFKNFAICCQSLFTCFYGTINYNYFFISNFNHVVSVVFFLFGDRMESEFYVPTFWNTLFHHHRSSCSYDLRRWKNISKRRYIKFRRRGGTLKK